LGYELYNIQLKVEGIIKSNKLIQFLKHHPKVIYYYKHLGHENWDIDFGVIVKDSLDLRKFILELRKKLEKQSKFTIYMF